MSVRFAAGPRREPSTTGGVTRTTQTQPALPTYDPHNPNTTPHKTLHNPRAPRSQKTRGRTTFSDAVHANHAGAQPETAKHNPNTTQTQLKHKAGQGGSEELRGAARLLQVGFALPVPWASAGSVLSVPVVSGCASGRVGVGSWCGGSALAVFELCSVCVVVLDCVRVVFGLCSCCAGCARVVFGLCSGYPGCL